MCLSARGLTTFATSALLLFVVNATDATALPGPCNVVGVPFAPNPAKKACEKITGAATDVAGDIAGSAAKAVAQPIFKQATEWVAQGAGWLVGRVGGLIDTSTTPRLQSRWFAGQYAQMGLLATALALPLLFLAVIQATLAHNARLITRALAAVPIAFVLTGGAVAIVAALLGVTDWACQAISGQTGPNSREFFGDVAKAFNTITTTAARRVLRPRCSSRCWRRSSPRSPPWRCGSSFSFARRGSMCASCSSQSCSSRVFGPSLRSGRRGWRRR
jgi:hypothetical protein